MLRTAGFAAVGLCWVSRALLYARRGRLRLQGFEEREGGDLGEAADGRPERVCEGRRRAELQLADVLSGRRCIIVGLGGLAAEYEDLAVPLRCL